MRIEGSQGLAEREFNGPVIGLQQRYREGLAALGDDYCELGPVRAGGGAPVDAGLRRRCSFTTCARGCTEPPSTEAIPTAIVWRSIGYEGDVQPRGWTDAEVSDP